MTVIFIIAGGERFLQTFPQTAELDRYDYYDNCEFLQISAIVRIYGRSG
jgi:hypothetical protein